MGRASHTAVVSTLLWQAIDGGLITPVLQDADKVKHFTMHNEC
jgi:hypothetical protein